MSEYDPLIPRGEDSFSDDLECVQSRFAEARRPYLNSPIPWLIWAMVLPGVALATPSTAAAFDAPGVLFLWSFAILIGGVVESTLIFRHRRAGATPLAVWVLRLQGNQSLVGLALSIFLFWQDLAWALPAVWLLLIGHSFFQLGGLAFRPLKQAGLIYEVGGLIALWGGATALPVFAAATALGNLRVAVALLREARKAG